MVLVVIYDRMSLSIPLFAFHLKYLKDPIIRYFQTLDKRYFTHDFGHKRTSNICG